MDKKLIKEKGTCGQCVHCEPYNGYKHCKFKTILVFIDGKPTDAWRAVSNSRECLIDAFGPKYPDMPPCPFCGGEETTNYYREFGVLSGEKTRCESCYAEADADKWATRQQEGIR